MGRDGLVPDVARDGLEEGESLVSWTVLSDCRPQDCSRSS